MWPWTRWSQGEPWANRHSENMMHCPSYHLTSLEDIELLCFFEPTSRQTSEICVKQEIGTYSRDSNSNFRAGDSKQIKLFAILDDIERVCEVFYVKSSGIKKDWSRYAKASCWYEGRLVSSIIKIEKMVVRSSLEQECKPWCISPRMFKRDEETFLGGRSQPSYIGEG